MWHRAVTLAVKRLLIAAGLCLQSLLGTSGLIRVHWEWGEHYSGNYPDVTWRGEKRVKKHEEIKAETVSRFFSLTSLHGDEGRTEGTLKDNGGVKGLCLLCGHQVGERDPLHPLLKNHKEHGPASFQTEDVVGYNAECSPPEGTWVHGSSSNAALRLSLTEPLLCGSSVGLD